jgi:multiple sugar transport system permease protein
MVRVRPDIRHGVVTAAFVVPFCAAILFPFAVMLSASLKTNLEIYAGAGEFRWLPENPLWGNFAALWMRVPLMGRYFANSAIIAAGATVLATVVSLPAAYALSRLQFRGRRLFLQTVLVTQMFSPIVIIIGLYKLFAATSVKWFFDALTNAGLGFLVPVGAPETLANNLFGLVLANAAFNTAFAVWMLSGYFASVPVEIEEAALVDGCSWWRMAVHVLVPLAAPGIVTAVIFVFIASWNEFIFALTLLASPERRPVIVGLFSLIGMYEVEWNLVMGGALLATLPMVVLFLVAERHITTGLTAGGIK